MDEDLLYAPRYNVTPTQQVLALINQDEVQPAFLRWRLIPPWAKDHIIGNRMINARAGKKMPVRVVLKSGEPFAFAGLWETWWHRAGEAIRSCTIGCR